MESVRIKVMPERLFTGLLKIHFSALNCNFKTLIYASKLRFLKSCLPQKIEFLETLFISVDFPTPEEPSMQ